MKHSKYAHRRKYRLRVANVIFVVHSKAASRRRLAIATVPPVLAIGRYEASGLKVMVVGCVAKRHHNLRQGFWEARME